MTASGYIVRIEPHGRVFPVAEGQSVLEAAIRAGINLPHSCRSGHCASCRAHLKSGDIHYPNGRTAGLTAGEAERGYVLLCQARARSDLLVEARVVTSAAAAEIKTLPCRIERMHRLAPDVMQVFLRLPAVEPLEFRAGQYLDVLLEGGGRRSFSIASPPSEGGQIELHVRRAPGGRFTEALFESIPAGSLLRIEGPLGQFIYEESPAPALLIAGGTGFAPIKSMLRQAFERQSRREIHFYWGVRTAADLYEHALVSEWVSRHPNLRFTPVLSEATGGAPGSREGMRTGWVHQAVLADFPDLSAFDIYAAGPPAMVDAIRATFPARGASEERLRFDSFDYADGDRSGAVRS